MQQPCLPSIGPTWSGSETCAIAAPTTCSRWTLSVAGSHARTFHWQAGDKGSKASAPRYGQSLPASLARLDRDGCWLKMYQDCYQATLDGSLERFCETWPRSGTMRSGTVYLLPPLVPLTDVTGCSLWPTPVANDDNKTPEAHLRMKARMKGGPRNTVTSLTVMVKGIERGLWPTPTANRWDGLQSHGVNVVTGQLNPTWVEWLMGFPLGWTDLDA